MIKKIKNLIIIVLLLFMIISCSSSPQTQARAAMSSNISYESDEVSRSSQNVSDDRMIAYSVSLELSVTDAEETRRSIIEQMRHNRGFIVTETESNITTRIPSENTDNFLNNIRILGTIESETRRGTDITDQYRDNVIRLNNLMSVRDRYLALLERADTVSDILMIERELERVSLEIERLEGRINHAELSVSYSIINVRFRRFSEPPRPVRPGPIGWIFYGLYRGVRWLFIWD